MMFNNNKKGIIFSLLAILLSLMFFLILKPIDADDVNFNYELNKNKASTISSYFDSLTSYSEYAIEIPAKICLTEITRGLIDNNVFFDDNITFLNNFTSCMFNATILDSDHVTNVENLTFSKLIDKLIVLTYDDYGINTGYDIRNIDYEFIQFDSIRLNLWVKFNITGSDIYLSPKLNKITVDIYFKDMYDPYYSINVGENKKIEDITLITDEELIGITFDEFLNNISYIQYKDGISLFDRLINNSVYSFNLGLITFVNESNPLSRINNSFVDVYYIDDVSFNCNQLWCRTGHCDDDDFAIDLETFLTLKTIYNLDITGWEVKC